MARQNLRMRLLERGELFIDRTRYQPVQVFAAAFEQSFVGGIPDECVLEQVDCLRSNATNVEQFRVGQSAQRSIQTGCREPFCRGRDAG